MNGCKEACKTKRVIETINVLCYPRAVPCLAYVKRNCCAFEELGVTLSMHQFGNIPYREIRNSHKFDNF